MPFQNIKLTLLIVTILHSGLALQAQNRVNGGVLFDNHCGSCHNFKTNGIGPQLSGLKGVLEEKYLTDFIANPKAMVDAKVSRAFEQYRKYKLIMPDFKHLPIQDLKDIAAYILDQPAAKSNLPSSKRVLQNPIPAKIYFSKNHLQLKKILDFPKTNETQPFTRITKMASHPITKENMVADLQGQLYIIDTDNKLTVYFNAQDHFPKFINKPGLAVGLGSFTFHPDFAKNGLFYTTHTEPPGSAKATFAYQDSIPVKMQWVLTEWTLPQPAARVLKGKPREILRVNVVTQIHGMQEITFNPFAKKNSEDYGLMYIGIGDGGAVEAGYPHIPKGRKQIWGKVLRINPIGQNSQNGQYGIPKSNPWVGKSGPEEIFAEGFRNPNRIGFTTAGKILVSNIGQHQIESLYSIKGGNNCGWPYREGTFAIDTNTTINEVYPLAINDKKYGFSYPILQFDHDEGNAIMGGYEYKGTQVPLLKGKYVFGEIVRGRVLYANIAEMLDGKQAKIYEFPLKINGTTTTLKQTTGQSKVDFRIGQDAAGELYIMTKADGAMYKIVK
jgi:glucose/arabinose dehydrogenase/cytochrome c553